MHSLRRGTLPVVAGIALSLVSVAHAEPAACSLVPLELPLFGGTPVAQVADSSTPAASPEVDESGVRSTLEQYVACVNTGDPTLVWAMFSPRWFASQFADPSVHYLPAFEQVVDGPVIPADPPLELTSIDGIDRLNDGRVNVTATFSSGGEEWTNTLTLVMIDGHWMIDDVHPGTPAR